MKKLHTFVCNSQRRSSVYYPSHFAEAHDFGGGISAEGRGARLRVMIGCSRAEQHGGVGSPAFV